VVDEGRSSPSEIHQVLARIPADIEVFNVVLTADPGPWHMQTMDASSAETRSFFVLTTTPTSTISRTYRAVCVFMSKAEPPRSSLGRFSASSREQRLNE
jgi:hypothetical protein